MKPGPVTKLDKKNKTTSKKFCDGVISENYEVISIFSIYSLPILSDVTIIPVKNVTYCCILHNISKSEETIILKVFMLKDIASNFSLLKAFYFFAWYI